MGSSGTWRYCTLNLLGPVEAFLAYFFPVTEIQTFKELVSLEETSKSLIKCLHKQ